MTNQSRQWPPYPHIPIYLETYDDNGTARFYNTISPISPNVRPQDGAIHSLAAVSTQYIPPVSPAVTHFSNLSPIWPTQEPATIFNQQQSLQPEPQSFPWGKPRLQFAGRRPKPPAISVTTPSGTADLGLGIENSGTSRNAPTILPSHKKTERSSNIAQIIEQKLWRYNSSENVIKRWLFEIISWWVSAISMAIIVGFLIYYRNGKLPRWYGGLTLNTVVSVLSKIAGAALILPVSEGLGQLKWSWFRGDSKKMWDFEIFDNASRGPWGALLLLVRTKGRALAALGALVTLFSLALDPFFQQAVDFPERWVLQSNSSIPKVVQYDPRYGIEYKNGVEIGRQDIDLRALSEKFFYDNGTQPMQLANGTRPEIPLSCPTSNCTWPHYDTLAVCSQCEDVSDQLQHGCFDATVDWIANLTGSGGEGTYPNGTMCGYFLNNTLMTGYSLDSGKPWANEVLLMRALPLITNPDRLPLYGDGSIRFKHIRNPLFDVVIVSAKDGTIESVRQKEPPVALECVLSWCVQTLKSTYSFGTYEEKVIRTVVNDTEGPFPWETKRVVSDKINGTTVFYHENPTIEIAKNDTGSILTYGVSDQTHRYTVTIFDDIFPSWTTVANASALPLLRFKFNIQKATMLKSLDFNPWLESAGIAHHMERLSSALTNAIRSSSDKEMISGDAYDKESYVNVRWEWLALPLGLLILGAVFLIATIRKTAREKDEVGVWKSSAIATLLYGLPDEMQRKITAAEGMGTPRAKAKNLKVKLHPKKGWRSSGNLISPITPRMKRNEPPPGWI